MNYPAPVYYYPFPMGVMETPLYGYYPLYADWRDFPPINTATLNQSVAAYPKLMKDASMLLSKLHDPHTAQQLMSAAQSGNHQEVDRIVASFGCNCSIATTFSPSSVKFTLNPHTAGIPCCELSMSLKWGK
ncbi:hypothetical protein [Paenibacillus hexagrammi]|uniref:Uncharacterized protein n=1 Tax=Paenibacillus hexagrammi TaxID=2908839 RepID=A0ABY3SGZ7_9BACL|nr:hypothetical protein [Paenibacillus sp. YPD9-1]UJF33004.1 hypothetical protein L0M14_26075 [Paenibacillus sp. YPD9-1]